MAIPLVELLDSLRAARQIGDYFVIGNDTVRVTIAYTEIRERLTTAEAVLNEVVANPRHPDNGTRAQQALDRIRNIGDPND